MLQEVLDLSYQLSMGATIQACVCLHMLRLGLLGFQPLMKWSFAGATIRNENSGKVVYGLHVDPTCAFARVQSFRVTCELRTLSSSFRVL